MLFIPENAIESIETLNPTLKTIYTRRAVRNYKNIEVDYHLIEQIIEAGRMAPSAINKQPWKFYVLTNRETMAILSKEIARHLLKTMVKRGVKELIKTTKDVLHFPHSADFLKGEDPVFHGAPVAIFITTPKDNEWAQLDTGMCSQNIMLAAKSLGLDSCPVGMAKYAEQSKSYVKLNIPKDEQVQLAIIVGYGNDSPAAPERMKQNLFFL